MNHITKAISALFILTLFSSVHAHNKVVVIPMAANPPECLIVGVGVECVETGKVKVPMDGRVLCQMHHSYYNSIQYTVVGQHVVFEVGSSTRPGIDIGLVFFNPSFNLEVIGYPGEIRHIEGGSGSGAGCAPPQYKYNSNFIAAGSEWKIVPVFSTDGASVTLDALVFERQP